MVSYPAFHPPLRDGQYRRTGPGAGEYLVYENDHLPCPVWWRADLPIPYTAGIGTTEFSPHGILLQQPDSLPQLIDRHALTDLTLYAFTLNREESYILLSCRVERLDRQCTFPAGPDIFNLRQALARWWGIEFTATLVPGRWQGWQATAYQFQGGQ